MRPLLGRAVRPLARVLTQPVVAVAVFSLFFSGWHFPAVYEGVLRGDVLHHSEHLIFIGTALLS